MLKYFLEYGPSTTFFANYQPGSDVLIHMAPSSAFGITAPLKLRSDGAISLLSLLLLLLLHHLLLYLVYMCKTLLNFIDAFNYCYLLQAKMKVGPGPPCMLPVSV